MDEIVGYIERITFQNEENGFTVAQIQEVGKLELTCVVGMMPSVQPGETVRCFGEWKQHLVHGMQFDLKQYRVEAPADILGIKKYLGSGLIKGIGAGFAARIVDTFGPLTLDIIDRSPHRLLEVKGLGKKRMERIQECWQEQKSIREVMIYLQSVGVSPSYAQRIYKNYGDKSITKVKENPYHLARDIFGIGFKTADAIAEKMGIAKDAPQRIDSGIEYSLSQLSNDGHVCYPVKEFIEEAVKILAVEAPLIEARIEALKEEKRIVLEEMIDACLLTPFIWLKSLHSAEVGVSWEIRRLLRGASSLRSVQIEKALTWVQEKLQIELAENQQKAVANALNEKLQIITGGPGTGKSTITRAILEISEKLTTKILLAAPTGRAAKRMSEITKRKASTIHSLLEYNPYGGGFKRNRENQLDCDLLIVDEASMIDTALMNSLLKAIPSHARVIFVGDVNQLPSVGPGNVLKDLISSNSIPVTTLTDIFRQAAGSNIVTNAHRINDGVFPQIYNTQESDFFFLEEEDPEKILHTIVNLVTYRLPKKYQFNPLQDIQVLTPMRRGVIGTENLNQVLQKSLNERSTPIMKNGRQYAMGDKVMQIKNNYSKEVFNGDVGYILSIDSTEQTMVIVFDDREVEYEFNDLDEIVLAYAVSVHKFQGSEYPCIVMPVHTCHYMLLHRNLLYTGVTRGKKLVVLIGTKKALSLAVRQDEVRKRYTGLRHSLSNQISSDVLR